MTDVEKEKRSAAARSVEFIFEGMTVGLGSGSTAEYFVKELGKRVRNGLRIQGVSTSEKTTSLAREEKVPLKDFQDVAELDVTVDGADEVDPDLNLIKGGGGALLREKIVASATRQLIIVCDSTKRVPLLGSFPLPVEVVPFGYQLTAKRIESLGSQVKVRREAFGDPFRTAQGNYILDCDFGRIVDPEVLAGRLKNIVGVVEHGLFVRLATLVIVGRGDRTELVEARREPVS